MHRLSPWYGLAGPAVGRSRSAREPPAAGPISTRSRRGATGSTSSAAKQSAPGRMFRTEMALSPPRIGSTASDPTCTRNTSSTSRSQMCARECTHPLRAIVRAGVQGWVLEQGEGSHNRGQQLVVHGDARRTVDSTYSRCCSSTLLRSAPPETHRPATSVPHLRRTVRWTSLEHIPRAGAPAAALSWPLGAGREHAWKQVAEA